MWKISPSGAAPGRSWPGPAPNDGAGAFSDSGQTLGRAKTQSVFLVDVGLDGGLDLGVGEPFAPIRIWRND